MLVVCLQRSLRTGYMLHGFACLVLAASTIALITTFRTPRGPNLMFYNKLLADIVEISFTHALEAVADVLLD